MQLQVIFIFANFILDRSKFYRLPELTMNFFAKDRLTIEQTM